MRECFPGGYAIDATRENTLGVVSLIFRSLVVVISIKYLALVMRANNRGEGGVLVLLSLIRLDVRERQASRGALMAIGIFGPALLYGDGMITPAISVLSAVEGLRVAAPQLRSLVEPLTIAILVGLFLLQRTGTARIGALFGPVTLVCANAGVGGAGSWSRSRSACWSSISASSARTSSRSVTVAGCRSSSRP